jgi:hypothetical protein
MAVNTIAAWVVCGSWIWPRTRATSNGRSEGSVKGLEVGSVVYL